MAKSRLHHLAGGLLGSIREELGSVSRRPNRTSSSFRTWSTFQSCSKDSGSDRKTGAGVGAAFFLGSDSGIARPALSKIMLGNAATIPPVSLPWQGAVSSGWMANVTRPRPKTHGRAAGGGLIQSTFSTRRANMQELLTFALRKCQAAQRLKQIGAQLAVIGAGVARRVHARPR